LRVEAEGLARQLLVELMLPLARGARRQAGGPLDGPRERANAPPGRENQFHERFGSCRVAAGFPALDFRELDSIQKADDISFSRICAFHVNSVTVLTDVSSNDNTYSYLQ
jgi:hypothetical protein